MELSDTISLNSDNNLMYSFGLKAWMTWLAETFLYIICGAKEIAC